MEQVGTGDRGWSNKRVGKKSLSFYDKKFIHDLQLKIPWINFFSFMMHFMFSFHPKILARFLISSFCIHRYVKFPFCRISFLFPHGLRSSRLLLKTLDNFCVREFFMNAKWIRINNRVLHKGPRAYFKPTNTTLCWGEGHRLCLQEGKWTLDLKKDFA